MAINPITFANRVNQQFLRYQKTAFPLSDENISAQAYAQIIGEGGASPLVKGPYVSLSRAYKIGPSIDELINNKILHPALEGIAQYPNVFEHQYQVLQAVNKGNHVIVSTGTGSGKTEAFLFPILNDCLKMRDEGAPDGVMAIIVYPMNALAIDQLDRLRTMLAGTGISFGMYVGTTPANENDLVDQIRPNKSTKESFQAKKAEIAEKKSKEIVCPYEERITEREIEQSPPRLLLTNFNQLEILLTRGKDLGLFVNPPLKYFVFDEAHTYSGVRGAEVSLLIRRLRAFAGKTADDVTCIASSATIYDEKDQDSGRNFASRFFGIDKNHILLVEEVYEAQKWASSLYAQPPFNGDVGFLDKLLKAIEANDQSKIAHFASMLTGFEFSLSENWQDELYEHFQTSKYVKMLFKRLQQPTHLDEAVKIIHEEMGRDSFNPESAKIELLSILALTAAAIKNDDSLLRPKLHYFVHGLQGAVGVLESDEEKNTLIKFYMSPEQAIKEFPDRLPPAFYPVSTCRVCGQHVLKTSLDGFSIEDGFPSGGDAEGENVFWHPNGDDCEITFTNRFIVEDEELDEAVEDKIKSRKIEMFVCPYCGTFHKHASKQCENKKCKRDVELLEVSVLIPKNSESCLVGCPSCGTGVMRISGREREPFRGLRAITVADVHILSQDMLNAGKKDEERLIVFTDNRQDAAFQAGWMQDHARRFRMRNLIYQFLLKQKEPVSLTDIERYLVGLYDTNPSLIRALCPEVFQSRTPEYFGKSVEDTLAKYIRIQLLMEFNTRFKYARSLETWGLLNVLYAYVNNKSAKIKKWAEYLNMDVDILVSGIQMLLHMWRRNANLIYDDEEPIYSHYWHYSDKEVSNGFLPYMDFPPKGIKLKRGASDKKSLVAQVISDHGLTIGMDFTKKWGLSAEESRNFLEELWDWLVEKEIMIPVQLTSNKGNPLSGCPGVYQINSKILGYQSQMEKYRCNLCHRFHPGPTPNEVCTAYHCKGKIKPVEISEEDYDISTLLNPFAMVMAQEHSAQVPNKTREKIEREFKNPKGSVNTLVSTPTLELGVDIGDLDIVLLRNVPPSAANYWQRVGRAGRRHRMAVLFTYCRNSDHDNYFFEGPYRLLRSPVDPPHFNLQNPVMIQKHVNAAILSFMIRYLEHTPEEFPTFIDGYLFDEEGNYRNEPLDVSSYKVKLDARKNSILKYLLNIFAQYWPNDAMDEVEEKVLEKYLDETSEELQIVVNRLFKRMMWTRKNIAELNKIEKVRPLNNAEEGLLRRCKEYRKSLQKHTASSYTLTVLASNGYLPGYGTYTGSIVGYAERFKTTTGQSVIDFELTRPPSIAIREFVPGNLIYANSGKFQVGLYHLAYEQNMMQIDRYTVNPETEVIKPAGGNAGYADPGSIDLPVIPISDVDLNYVSRIIDEEYARFQMPTKIMGLRKKSHRGGDAYTYGNKRQMHHMKGQDVRLVNVGPSDLVRKEQFGYWVCSVCGGVRSPYAYESVVEKFKEFHQKKCGREPEPIGFSADVNVDGLLFRALEGVEEAANLGELLKRAAANVIEMEVEDLLTLIFNREDEKVDLFIYDPMPGGSGLLKQIIENWGKVKKAGLEIAEDCPRKCETSCYECLRSYRNIYYHNVLDRNKAAEIFKEIENLEHSHKIPENVTDNGGKGKDTLPSEEILANLLKENGFPEPDKQIEIPIEVDGYPKIKRTTPDFAYKEKKIAIYLDGMSGHIHGNDKTKIKDSLIRDKLDELGWTVLSIQCNELSDPVMMGIHYRKLSRALGVG
jgi:ATP-dependent helicase YprA (DUF1998 family)